MKIYGNIWNGDLSNDCDKRYVKGLFYTNNYELSSTNYNLFRVDNYILKIFYTHNEIVCSNYMKKYGIDYEKH